MEKEVEKMTAFKQGYAKGFKDAIQWERGRKVETFEFPITREGKEIFLTAVKKKGKENGKI